MYQTLKKILEKIFKKSTVFKYGFNLSPMYRRSTGRLTYVSDDIQKVDIKIPLSYKNRNYVGSVFGGSLFSATDPIYMIQLLNILDENYVVWDKHASIRFRRPVKQDAYVNFVITDEDLENIKKDVAEQKEIDFEKVIQITNKQKDIVFAEVTKIIYVADKEYYKEKRRKKSNKVSSI